MQKLLQLFDEGCCHELDAAYAADTVIAFGEIGGCRACGFALCGALDLAAAAKIKKILNLAQTTGCPVVGVYACNGVALGEGFAVLAAYGEIVKLAARLSGVVPQISIIDGACLGMTAAMAHTADAVIAVKGSDYCIAPPGEISVQESSAEGALDVLADTFEEAVSAAQTLLSLLPENNLASLPVFEYDAGADTEKMLSDGLLSFAFQKNYAAEVAAELTTLGGHPVGVLHFQNKSLTAAAAKKATAFIKLCDAYGVPVVTVADSEGIQRGENTAALTSVTELLCTYASATCPKISLITASSVAGAYVLLAGKGANADAVLAWESATVSPMPVDSAVAFLWNDRLAAGENRASLENEYQSTQASAASAAAAGVIDEVITKEQTREKLIQYLTLLASKRETTIPRKHSVK